MNANPGDLVVCVDDAPLDDLHIVLVKAGRVYRVLSCCAADTQGTPGYTLDGVEGWLPRESGLIPYRQSRFRKLNDSNDDLELIERIKNCRPVQTPITAALSASGLDLTPLTEAELKCVRLETELSDWVKRTRLVPNNWGGND